MVLTLEALAVSRIKTLLKLVLYDLDKNTNCSIFYDTGCIMYVFTGGVVARQKCQSDDYQSAGWCSRSYYNLHQHGMLIAPRSRFIN